MRPSTAERRSDEGQAAEFPTAKPKRLRFVLLNTVGRLVRNARETLLRVTTAPARALLDLARIAIHLKTHPLCGVGPLHGASSRGVDSRAKRL